MLNQSSIPTDQSQTEASSTGAKTAAERLSGANKTPSEKLCVALDRVASNPNALPNLLDQLDRFWEIHWDEMLADLDRLVAIESVEDLAHAAPGAPFGPGPAQALETFLTIADRMGFTTKNVDGYAGIADMVGDSPVQVGIIGHVDVVPIGEGWTVDPLRVTVRDSFLLGRGTSDDKGPLLMSLYAAKFWMDKGRALPYTLRYIVGANEETGMRDVEQYRKIHGDPAVVFTPDDEFPACYGEKGQIQGAITSPQLAGVIQDIQGGIAPNAVPGSASALVAVPAVRLKPADGIEIETRDGGTFVTARGVQAHAAMPESGTSAILHLVAYLAASGICSPAEQQWLSCLETWLGDFSGMGLGIASCDEAFGPLTAVGGMISMQNGRIRQTIDIRFTTASDPDVLEKTLVSLTQSAGGVWETTRLAPVFLMNPESPFMQALISSYRAVTGDNQPAFTIGGGTYARHFSCAAGFGASVCGKAYPSWVGGMHAADEGVAIADLKNAFKVYAVAIDRLMALDLCGEL